MASRPELIQIALELDMDTEGLSHEALDQAVREAIDKTFNKKYLVSPTGLSDTLKKFMTEEFDYYLVDKDGKRYNHKGEPIK